MIKKGLKVKILSGKDKNKDGEVIEIDRKNNRAKVKGINIVKKHVKTTKEKKGGIISKESFIHNSNVKNLDKNIIFVLSSNKEISVRSCPGVKIVVKFLFTSLIFPSSRRMSGFVIFPAYEGVFIEAISFKKLVGALCFSA